MNDKSLFGNISLGSGNFIEIPEVGEPSTVVEETTDTTSKNSPTKEAPNEDGMIEIPDTLVPEKSVEQVINEIETGETPDNDKDKNTPPSKGSSSSSPILPFAKALYEEGVLTSFDEEEFTKMVDEVGYAEALIEMNRRTINSEIESYKSEAEEAYKSFLEAREAGVDLNEWAQVQELKNQLNEINDETIENDEELQKSLITSDLKARGMDEDTVKDMLESFEDTGKLAKQAKNSFKNLKIANQEHEKAQVAQAKERDAENAKKQKEQLDNLKKKITDTIELIPGMPLNKQVKDKLYGMIINPVKQTEEGQSINAIMAKRAEDPIRFAMLEAYFVELGLYDGKFDKLVTKAKTKAVKELESQLSKGGNTGIVTGGKDTLEDENDVDRQFKEAFRRIK